MGTCGESNVHAIKYFNEIEEIKETNNKPLKQSLNYVDNLQEKLKLEFSLRNCDPGAVYSITGLLLEDNQSDFKTEEKKALNNEINFDKFYICDYYFEKQQNLQIIIYKGENPVTIMTALASVVGSRLSEFMKQIGNKEILIIKAVKLGKDKSYVNIKINITNDNENYLKKYKLFFKINANNTKIYSSEGNNNSGFFKEINIPSFLLSPQYTVDFYECKDNKFKGSYTKSLDQLKMKNSEKNIQCKIPMSKNILYSIYDNSKYIPNFSFFDLISSGLRLKLSIGIDFTGSNGHPLDMNTLHCIIDDKPNDYEKVIKSIGNILSNYNNEKLYPVYGFGAILNNSLYEEVSMCFNINFQDNPEIHTIDNVIQVYRQNLEKLTFAGPTYFSPIINKVIRDIKSKDRDSNQEYNILMILTDGVIDDIQETIDALVEGSFLPLSVVIVGIGNADFSNMVVLDGNENPLISSQNKKWMRDLVQFIHYNKYKNDEKTLTKEILEEIPRQIIEYHTLNHIYPDNIREIARKNSMKYNYNNNNNDNNNNNGWIGESVLDLPTKSLLLLYNNKNNNNNNNSSYNDKNNQKSNQYDDIFNSNNNNYNNDYANNNKETFNEFSVFK